MNHAVSSTYPILALDISTPIVHGTLLTSKNHALHAQGEVGKQHSDSVLPLLQSLLHEAGITWTDLKLLALGQGPGSFTGLRIAAASMAGINASLKLPIWGMSSLAITSMQVGSKEDVWVIEDARAQEVFLGCYQQGIPQQNDICLHISKLDSIFKGQAYVCSSDFHVGGQTWHRLPFTYDRAHAMSRLIQQNIDTLNIQSLPTEVQPNYLQLSQAERLLEHA